MFERDSSRLSGPDHGPCGPWGMKSTCGPLVHIFAILTSFYFYFYCYPHCLEMLFSSGVNCGRTSGRIEMPLGKNFGRPQTFSLEISGPKVVLLCTFSSLYRAVRAPIWTRVLRLQLHQPHGWSGPEDCGIMCDKRPSTCTDVFQRKYVALADIRTCRMWQQTIADGLFRSLTWSNLRYINIASIN